MRNIHVEFTNERIRVLSEMGDKYDRVNDDKDKMEMFIAIEVFLRHHLGKGLKEGHGKQAK